MEHFIGAVPTVPFTIMFENEPGTNSQDAKCEPGGCTQAPGATRPLQRGKPRPRGQSPTIAFSHQMQPSFSTAVFPKVLPTRGLPRNYTSMVGGDTITKPVTRLHKSSNCPMHHSDALSQTAQKASMRLTVTAFSFHLNDPILETSAHL